MLEQIEKLIGGKKKASMADELMSEDPDVKDEDEGYCSEQTADLTSDDSDLEERTQLDVVRFSRCYVKTYKRHDCYTPQAEGDDSL